MKFSVATIFTLVAAVVAAAPSAKEHNSEFIPRNKHNSV
jgi:hypothetical protein